MSDFTTAVKTVVARREHDCCAYERVMYSGYAVHDFPESYHDALNKIITLKGKIQKGEEHYQWSGRFDGDMFTAKANKEMYDLIFEMDWHKDN